MTCKWGGGDMNHYNTFRRADKVNATVWTPLSKLVFHKIIRSPFLQDNLSSIQQSLKLLC